MAVESGATRWHVRVDRHVGQLEEPPSARMAGLDALAVRERGYRDDPQAGPLGRQGNLDR